MEISPKVVIVRIFKFNCSSRRENTQNRLMGNYVKKICILLCLNLLGSKFFLSSWGSKFWYNLVKVKSRTLTLKVACFRPSPAPEIFTFTHFPVQMTFVCNFAAKLSRFNITGRRSFIRFYV